MTGKSILERLTDRADDTASHQHLHDDEDAAQDFISFGWLRGVRDRAPMLEFRKKCGNILAKSYGWLESASFDPSDGITLSFGGQQVRIKGRHLNTEIRPSIRLFEGVTRHRVPYIQETNEPDSMEASENTTVIESIEW